MAGDSDGRIEPQDALDEERRPTFPVFVFAPSRHDNPEIGLAGRLLFNAFGRRLLKLRARREVAEIIARLETEARAGRLKPDGVVVGWPGTCIQPPNAVDVSDAAAMRSWRKRAYKLELRPTMTDVADGRSIAAGKDAL